MVDYHNGEFCLREQKNRSWLTQAMMNSAWKRCRQEIIDVQNSERKRSEIYLSQSTTSLGISLSDLSKSHSSNKEQLKGGRPVGTTLAKEKKREEQIMMMKNDITQEYKREIEMTKKRNRRVRNGILMDIIQKHKEKRQLKVHIPLFTIQQRVVRKNLIINNHHSGGHQSPLTSIDSIVVGILCQMSRLQNCLPPLRALWLINLLIEDQPIQKDLIEWKQKYSNDTKGTVGTSYWNSFSKRHRYLLVSKLGQKYEPSRHNCTPYANFVHMYTHIYEEMVCAEVMSHFQHQSGWAVMAMNAVKAKPSVVRWQIDCVILNFALVVTKLEETLAWKVEVMLEDKSSI